MSWRDDAACLGMDLSVFFDPADEELALATCAVCPVRSQCLADADSLEYAEADINGVRGGQSEAERRRRHEVAAA